MNLADLNPEQRTAYDRATSLRANDRIAAITGPAGTGKTVLMQLIADYYTAQGKEVALAAPTGKAARRIREATGHYSMTIHRLLEYSKPGDRDPRTGKPARESFPARHRAYPCTADVFLIDEYAMTHSELHDNLLAAMKPGSVLVAFGDMFQLPPIETSALVAKQPSPFKRLLAKFNGVMLTQVHRQVGDSGILLNAQRILQGRPPQRANDFEMVGSNVPVDSLRQRAKDADYTTRDNQIITPANVSWVGTHKLNTMLQGVFFPHKRDMLVLERHKWHDKLPVSIAVGDKVILTANWYALECSNGELGVFNGESGTVTHIEHDTAEITVDLGDRTTVIPPQVQTVLEDRILVGYPHRDLLLGYAVTTHKAQGSEYDNVIYVLNRSIANQCNRKNLYTAVTRAKEKVTLIFDSMSLSMSLSQVDPRVWETTPAKPARGKGK